jgi:hypothetical protein
MITVRIAHATAWPGEVGDGRFLIVGYLVVLADDARHRAVPVWFLHGKPDGADSLPRLLDEPDAVTVTAGVPEDLGARLLRAAGAAVTGVTIETTTTDAGELTPETAIARIELASPMGRREVTARLGLGLAVAAAAMAPVLVADAVLDRLAVPVPGDDMVGPILDRIPADRQWAERRARVPGRGPAGGTHPRHRFEPRNLAFADGLDRWDLGFGDSAEAGQPGERDHEAGQPGARDDAAGQPGARDYTSGLEDRSAVLSAAVPRPAGSASLVQTIFADDYQGSRIVFSGEIRTEGVSQQAGLRLEILTRARPVKAERGPRGWQLRHEHVQRRVTVSGSSSWTRQEVTALVPDDAELIRFGITLTGPGLVALRSPDLTVGG